MSDKSARMVVEVLRPSAVQLPDYQGQPGQLLMPGENSVESGYWAACEQHLVVRMWIDAGYLRAKGAGVAQPIITSLEALSAKDAIDKIERASKAKLLEAWRRDEDRKTVLAAIDKRLEALAE